jgi:hypothetical protein
MVSTMMEAVMIWDDGSSVVAWTGIESPIS